MVRWPELENYLEILDDVDVNLDESNDLFPVIFGDDTNQMTRPKLKK